MSYRKHKLCVSLLPGDTEELKKGLAEAANADIIEIRLDYLPNANLKEIRRLTSRPLIITLRTTREGGYWKGPYKEYLKVIQKAIKAKMDYIDVEWGTLKKDSDIPAKRHDTRVILSHHTTENDETVLQSTLRDMSRLNADVYKLIFAAETFGDNLKAVRLADEARALNIPFIIHATGEKGQLSRILGALFGNQWTYTALQHGQLTASGQLVWHEAEHFYHLSRKTSRTKLIGLVGNPIYQSKGWRIHNELFHRKFSATRASDKDFLYVNFPVDNLREFWNDWKDSIHGVSVTIPYKEKIIKYLNELSTDVRISGVCNTVVKTPSGWKGYNTDLIAMETLLRPHRSLLREGALVVGTGATARSAIAALKRLEVSHIFVVGRNTERGKMLAEKFNVEYLEEDEVHYAGASAVIQTTPVGMVPYTDRYPVGSSLFRRDRLVFDVIYNPPETRFLQIARERGCLTISGLEMFFIQAARQFELFTGEPVTVEEIRDIWKDIM